MRRRIVVVLVILLALAFAAALALWIAIQRNGPAVLDTVDRLAGPSSAIEKVHEASTGDHPEQRLMVYRDSSAEGPLPVVVFFHGGAWAHGSPADYGFVARNIAPEGYIAVLGGYRMNEPGRYPAMLEDTAAVIGWVHRSIAEHGGDPTRIILSGHSAGAYNVVQAVLDPQWLAAEGVPASAVRGIVGLAGPYDFYPWDGPRTRAAFGSVNAGEDSQPVNQARPGAPPMLFVHGEDDTVVRIRNSRALEEALEAEGNRVETLYLPGKNHNDPLLALANPWRRDPQVFDRVTQFMGSLAPVSVPVQPETP